jgi:hypothetical protein
MLDEITLELNLLNLKKIVNDVVKGNSNFTHYQIATWCSDYVNYYDEFERIPHFLTIAEDIDNQWELFLTNKFTFDELKTINLNNINMPLNWFEEWNKKLNTKS